MIQYLLLTACIVAPILLKAQTWTVQTANTSFRTSMFGADVDGTFKGFKGTVIFDPLHPETARISGSVEAATLSTSNRLRDRHLKEKDQFFEVAKYPRIAMKSTKIEKTVTGYTGTFDLTLKTVTKSVFIPFTFTKTGANAVMKAAVEINRKDWKFGGNTLGMSNKVKLDFELNLSAPVSENK
ncbi:polyisoprenoid-binding protein [Dyadobacter beijingensis]|uniref:Polyisoprenoid-binding protein n=1 Tax=Dyadobacter beijingensis TaxID=365489 RepID=A0ABQ2HW19_9BACT|nr:YceI family protein [Dyadobacter beijingensis]GGM90546.1 polyisoprenoid-binding protein [Dyadobacter beijingensis]